MAFVNGICKSWRKKCANLAYGDSLSLILDYFLSVWKGYGLPLCKRRKALSGSPKPQKRGQAGIGFVHSFFKNIMIP